MWISSTAKQAIQAVLCIAASEEDGPVRADEIAAVLGVPRNYLSKTLHVLGRAGVLSSGRGPHGGFRLSKPPARLTLAEVVEPIDPIHENRCLAGRATCGDANPCALHHRWSKVASGVDAFFRKTTIESLLRGNPRATAEGRVALRKLRHPNPRTKHGSRSA
jgi:Rrf2 family protein